MKKKLIIDGKYFEIVFSCVPEMNEDGSVKFWNGGNMSAVHSYKLDFIVTDASIISSDQFHKLSEIIAEVETKTTIKVVEIDF